MSEFLKIKGLCKSFQSGSEKLQILKNLELEVEQGQMIAVTGASGGGTQTFMLCALDPRPRVAFPAVMISTGMQGGCTMNTSVPRMFSLI